MRKQIQHEQHVTSTLHPQSPLRVISLPPLKVCTHQIPAVVVPERGDSAGAWFPQQAESEAAVDVHPDLLLW